MRDRERSTSMISWALVLAGALLGAVTISAHGGRAGVIRMVALALWGAGIWRQLEARVDGKSDGVRWMERRRATPDVHAAPRATSTEAVLA